MTGYYSLINPVWVARVVTHEGDKWCDGVSLLKSARETVNSGIATRVVKLSSIII